jgi:hypothetical protein
VQFMCPVCVFQLDLDVLLDQVVDNGRTLELACTEGGIGGGVNDERE